MPVCALKKVLTAMNRAMRHQVSDRLHTTSRVAYFSESALLFNAVEVPVCSASSSPGLSLTPAAASPGSSFHNLTVTYQYVRSPMTCKLQCRFPLCCQLFKKCNYTWLDNSE